MKTFFRCGVMLLTMLSCPTVWRAKTSNWVPLDPTLKSCAEFRDANSHLDFGDDYYVMKSNSTIERPSLELGADEKEIDSFMIWYELTGHYELFKTGQACVEDTQEKYGEVRGMEAAIFIQWERRAKSDFFAKQLLKRFTGRSLN